MDVTDELVSLLDSEALRDNNTKLQRVIDRCSERHVILNAEKMVKGKEMSFHGHTITSRGIKAYPKKITALLDMTSPTDKAGVRRFCGIVQYMARFLPGLSTTLKPIHKLTRKDSEFIWFDECEKSFEEVKDNLTSAPVLAYLTQRKNLLCK